jgi:hypothetical protein
MKNLFVPYEIALALKKRKFNQPCFGSYENKKLKIGGYVGFEGYHYVDAPIYQQVVDWLMDEHFIFIKVNCETWLHTFNATIENADGIIETKDTNDYYEAFNDAIKGALKIIKKD